MKRKKIQLESVLFGVVEMVVPIQSSRTYNSDFGTFGGDSKPNLVNGLERLHVRKCRQCDSENVELSGDPSSVTREGTRFREAFVEGLFDH